MIPTFLMRLTVDLPGGTPGDVDEIISWMREGVQHVTEVATQFSKTQAPGKTLKDDIASSFESTDTGGLGTVWMPYQFRFTLPPGTQRHFIPGGLEVNNYRDAAQIQMDKGYPMGFFWEKRGEFVHRWSVWHPGYKGKPWDQPIYEATDAMTQEVNETIADRVMQRWGSEAV